ncbi:hypothetical protein ACI2KR_30015 [Pseudomonas luteola]
MGGEPTFLPYEYWEQNLPYAVEKAREFAKITKHASPFILNTNLIVKDPRYFDLFNRYSTDDDFQLFISWEPDTQRYGSRDKLYKKYLDGMSRLNNGYRTLSLVATKKLIEGGVSEIIENHVKPHNFRDIAVAMLYQFGSGKTFFDESMPTFSEISQFYIDLSEALPDIIMFDDQSSVATMSPFEEVRQSLLVGRSFSFMGNDHFDLEIEPDGTISFNSSMTGSEAQMPSRVINIEDDMWAVKVLFENTPMLNKKLNGRYDFCRQCKYQRYCLGGYYHYKLLDRSTVDQLMENGEGDCPGYKKFWAHVENRYSDQIKPIYESKYYRAIDLIKKKAKTLTIRTTEGMVLNETEMAEDGYTAFLNRCLECKGTVLINREKLFSKSVEERVWFYDSLGIKIAFSNELIERSPSLASIVQNYVYGNFRTVKLDDSIVITWLNNNPDHILTKDVGFALALVKRMDEVNVITESGFTNSPDGLVVDERNTELFQWAYETSLDIDALSILPDSVKVSKRSFVEVERMIDFAVRERGIKGLLNA